MDVSGRSTYKEIGERASLRRPVARGLRDWAAAALGDEAVRRDDRRDPFEELSISLGRGCYVQLGDLRPLEDDRPRRRRRRTGADRRAGAELVAFHEAERDVVITLVQDADDLAQHVVCVAAPVEDAVERFERAPVAGHVSQSSPSKALIVSRYQSGIAAALRSSRSIRTSVWSAVTIRTSSSTRYVAHS